MLPVVSIEFPPELPPALVATTVQACEITLGSGCCRPRSERDERELPWIASVVVSETGQQSYRIQLQRGENQPVQLRFSRTLAFEAKESETERWSTVGVVVAALVVSASTAPPSAVDEKAPDEKAPDGSRALDSTAAERAKTATDESAKASPTRAPLPVAAPHKPPEKVQRKSSSDPAGVVRVALHAVYTGTSDSPSTRGGALVVPSLLLSDITFVWAGVGMSIASQSVSTQAWSSALGLGVGAFRHRVPLGLEGRIGIQGELVSFRAEQGGQRDQDRRGRLGPCVGFDLRFALTPSLDVLVSATGAALFPKVRVNVRGQAADTLGPWQGATGVGLRAWFGP